MSWHSPRLLGNLQIRNRGKKKRMYILDFRGKEENSKGLYVCKYYIKEKRIANKMIQKMKKLIKEVGSMQ